MIPSAGRMLLLGALVAVLARAGSAVALPDAAIRLAYPGARLRIDDREPALADTGTVLLPAGDYRLTLYLPPREGRWLPPILARPISLAAGETMLIEPAAVRTVHVSTLPAGARVRVAGVAVGTTPCLVSLLRQEDREMIVAKTGYRTERVPPGGSGAAEGTPLRIRLEPTGGGTHLTVAPPRSRGWLPWVTFSAFVASTVAGFYSRQRADDLYDGYLHTASAERRDDLFDRAATWDDRARALWIGGQVALGASVWLLLRRIHRREADRDRGLDLSIDPAGPDGVPSIRLAWAWGGAPR